MPFKFFVGNVKNFIRCYNMTEIWPNMWRLLEIKSNMFKIISTKVGPSVFLCTKGISAKLLVWFFAAVEMQIISKTLFVELAPQYYHFWLKWWFWHKNGWHLKKKNCILIAAKNLTSNFVDTPFNPEYFISSKVILNCTLQSALPT